jgi:hypothetical protein
MADLGNGGNHLEAELRELDGVAGAFALRDATGNPVEIQIFSRAGASAARIRKAVGDVLAKKGHELSPDAVSVFELAADSPAGRWVFAPPAVTAPASSETDSSPTILPARPRSIPVASLVTTALAIVGLLLLLTAPWVALTRLMSEPLQTAASATRAPDGLDRGGSDGGASTKLPPVTVTLEPTTPPNQGLVAAPAASAPTSARTVRVRTGRAAIVAAPAITTAAIPAPPAPVIATPAPAPSSAPTTPTLTGRGSQPRLSAAADEDDDLGDDDDAEERRSKRRGPKVIGFIPLPPGHERHHDRTRNGKAQGLDKHKHLLNRDEEESERDDD